MPKTYTIVDEDTVILDGTQVSDSSEDITALDELSVDRLTELGSIAWMAHDENDDEDAPGSAIDLINATLEEKAGIIVVEKGRIIDLKEANTYG